MSQHRALITQALLLFGTTHYQHYDFLLSVSAQIGGIGLEHHQSSEDGTTEGYFTEYKDHWPDRGLLPHEYTHSWNGKFRRPADLATPNYNVPMEGTLLWVYEGQTDYWGNVLTARQVFRLLNNHTNTSQQSHPWKTSGPAATGEVWRTPPGREAMGGDSSDWRSWQRYAGDYYREMDFVWMQADAMIRRDSSGKRSLDTFALLFFGINPGERRVRTYQFDDVVTDLQAVDDAVDWSKFLRGKLDSHAGRPGTEALHSAGWHVIYNTRENLLTENRDTVNGTAGFIDSIGFDVAKDGHLSDVAWEGGFQCRRYGGAAAACGQW